MRHYTSERRDQRSKPLQYGAWYIPPKDWRVNKKDKAEWGAVEDDWHNLPVKGGGAG